jgi:hypothetical protein
MFHRFLLLFLAIASTAATAAEKGGYVGLGAGAMILNEPGAGDYGGFSAKLLAGYRISANFAVELGHIRGSDLFRTGTANSTTVYGLGAIAFEHVDLFAEIGLAQWRTRGSTSTSSYNDSGTGFAFGLGAQVNWGRSGVRLEFEQNHGSPKGELQTFTVSYLFRFQ